jgi:putative aldouronate transport system substrate-binding protein
MLTLFTSVPSRSNTHSSDDVRVANVENKRHLMTSRTRKLVVPALVALLLLAGCSGGDDESDETEETEPYEVNFAYMTVGGEPTDELRAAVSDLAMSELGMTVNLIPITFADYFSKLPLMLASGTDPLDIMYVFSQDFGSFVDAQYIVNAADYVEQTQDIYELFGEDADTGKIGDFLVGFPTAKERANPAGLIVRKDIFDELGYSVDDFSVTTDDYASFDQITDLFADVKAQYPDMIVMDGTFTLGLETFTYIDPLGDSFGVLEDYGQGTTVTNWYESEQYRTFAEINREWYESGFLSQDIAVNQDEGEVKMQAGNTFAFVKTFKPNTAIEKLSQTGYEVEIIPISEGMKSTGAGALLSVAGTSEDPAKAFEFLNWAYTNGEFNDLLNWGVEGVDWVETSDGLADFPEGGSLSTVGYHNDAGFLLPNQFAGHVWAGNPPNLEELYAEQSEQAVVSEAYGFFFDPSPVTNQLAQLNPVLEQYKKQVAFGVVDPESGIAEFNDALYAAGLQDVIREKQRQLDAWLAER